MPNIRAFSIYPYPAILKNQHSTISPEKAGFDAKDMQIN
jgi:hypothetical protein